MRKIERSSDVGRSVDAAVKRQYALKSKNAPSLRLPSGVVTQGKDFIIIEGESEGA